MRAAVYVRVSTDEQAEHGHSIEAQTRSGGSDPWLTWCPRGRSRPDKHGPDRIGGA